jgi:predicted lipoprotein with Yx(FWY)xxD motif
MRTRLATLVLGAAVLVGTASAGAPAATAPSAQDATRATLTVRGSNWGPILFDTRGRALYAFTRDPRGRSACSGACANAWPPYLLRGRMRAGSGVRASLLGTTRRRDGSRQVTYAGRPLYYYVGDRRPGEVRCQNVFGFGGLWLVMRPNGRVVR